MGDGNVAEHSKEEGGWPGGWLVAALAGLITAILARWLGDVGMAAAVLVGIMVFLVFGVLLGMFWTVPAATGGDDGHGASHGHDADHGSSHVAAQIPAIPVQPVMAAAAPVAARAPAATPTPAAIPTPMAAPAHVSVETPVPASAPAATAVPEGGVKPVGLAAPRGGKGDDLQILEGIGPALEKQCHELGIYHFDQIAGWGPGEVAWMDGNLKNFKGRVTRDKWLRQARLIGEVGIEEFLRRAKTNDY